MALNVKTQKVIPSDGATIYFWTNYETEEELIAHEQELCRQIEAEGAALLINRDNTLPLSAGTFKKIIVLQNSSNSMQLDFLDDYGIDAVLWIGDVGMTGTRGVADILSGAVNPSGRIVDTFLKDNHAAPAMQNFGAYVWTNGADYDVMSGRSNVDQPGVTRANRDYVVYQEGIYIGYRYFETRYEDFVLGQSNAGAYTYDDVVAFPFGYGLSYTEFAYSNFKTSDKGDTIQVDVDVTNVGSVNGKHTVQIYFQSPYTDYDKENLVEKASVELCGFDKKMIAAGKTEHFTISVAKKDLVSYDSNGARTYIMDAGDYYFTVGKNAHDAVNNILAAKGADSTKMSGTGDASLTAVWNNPTLDTTTYSVSATGYPITNQFDDVNLNKYSGNGGQVVTYLSRSNWVDTYPTTQVLHITEDMWADGLTHDESGRQAIVERMKADYYAGVTMPTMGKDAGLKVADYAETDRDSDTWQALVEQVPYDEMINVIYNAFHYTEAAPTIGLPGTLDENGPQGFTASLLGGASAMAYTSEDVMAATYNLELIADMGSCIGEDFLHATEEGADKVFAGIYGPGANIHRTPYSGRNFEYYSEDGWLSGKVAAVEVAAIQDRGVYVFIKHCFLNDQEEGRYGISTWANEQAIREIYLEGFRGAVEEGGTMGVMTSFNRLGVVWSGAHYGLMTNVLRNEWGMKGAAITDCSVMANYMDYRMGILAGQDLWDGYSMQMATLDGLQNDPAIVTAVQRAFTNICYSVSYSHAMNVGNATIIEITPWWEMALIALACTFTIAALGCGAMIFVSKKKAKAQ